MGSGEMTKNLINLDVIKIIQFCSKICDLQRHSQPHTHPWVDVRVVGWVCGSMGGLRSND